MSTERLAELLKELDGVAAVNLAEPSPGALELVTAYAEARAEVKRLEAERDEWVHPSFTETIAKFHAEWVIATRQRDAALAELRDLRHEMRMQTNAMKERDGARAALEDRDKMHAEHVQAIEAERLRLQAERDEKTQALEHCHQQYRFRIDRLETELREVKIERDAARYELRDADERVAQLEAALVGLKRGGGCFCEAAIGHPLLSDHTQKCKDARNALAGGSIVTSIESSPQDEGSE